MSATKQPPQFAEPSQQPSSDRVEAYRPPEDTHAALVRTLVMQVETMTKRLKKLRAIRKAAKARGDVEQYESLTKQIKADERWIAENREVVEKERNGSGNGSPKPIDSSPAAEPFTPEPPPAPTVDAYEHLREVVHRIYHIDDPDLLQIVCGTITAHTFHALPLWVVLVGPASTIKTDIIEGAASIDLIRFIGKLTENTFVSGLKQDDAISCEDPSLLPKLDGKIIAIKDLSTIFSRKDCSAILSQLRDIYDQHFSADFGTGQSTNWEGFVGCIAASTPVIDDHYQAINEVGQRFLLYRPRPSNRAATAKKAMDNLFNESPSTQRAEVRAAFRVWYRSLSPISLQRINILPRDRDSIEALADLIAICRSRIRRGKGGHIIATADPEGPPRLTQQLALLAAGIAAARGRTEVNADDMRAIRHTANSNVIPSRLKVMKALWQHREEEPASIGKIMRSVLLSWTRAKEIVEELHDLGLAEEVDDEEIRGWRLTSMAQDLIGRGWRLK